MQRNNARFSSFATIMRIACLLIFGVPMIASARIANAQDDLRVDLVQTGRNDDSDTVRGELVFRVRAFDPNEGNRDGDGIRNVEMSVIDESNNRTVAFRREDNAGYCAFGGGEPNCSVYNFAAHGYRWPKGDRIRDGGDYTLRVVVNTDDGRTTDPIDFPVRIETGEDDGGDRSDLRIDLMQTGRNDRSDEVDGELVFRVRAFDPDVGNRDGDGIRNVEMSVVDESNDRTVAFRTENDAGYCAFGGGEPDCNGYDFSDHNNRWPKGDRIRDGAEYILRVKVTADDGRTRTEDFSVTVNR